MKRIGIAALARPTFDVPYAQEMAGRAFTALEEAGFRLAGSRELLFDAAAARAALASLSDTEAGEKPDALLLLQVTFTDATMTVEFARAMDLPLAIWAFPEPREGGRLRLNSFCGLNLALHALGRAGKSAAYLYSAPDAPDISGALQDLMGGRRPPAPINRPVPATRPSDVSLAEHVADRLKGKVIGLVGQHPDGFDTCRYEPQALKTLAGVSVEPIMLAEVFAKAHAVPEAVLQADRARVAAQLKGLDDVDQPQLMRSLAVYESLADFRQQKGLAALAVRCWPEMFTEYGCAACAPLGMLTEARTPCACEADVYGALTSLILQEVAQEPSWLVDIVDMDKASDTGVFWHCGSAPLSMCDPEYAAETQIHSNRRMPLLQQFPLKPGRITIARVTQARNEVKLVIGGAEVQRAPLSFTGTSAVVTFDGGIDRAMHGLLDGALEHHVALVYGDHRGVLRALGARLGIPVINLTA
jgi:L-fucose isomerase-like protein